MRLMTLTCCLIRTYPGVALQRDEVEALGQPQRCDEIATVRGAKTHGRTETAVTTNSPEDSGLLASALSRVVRGGQASPLNLSCAKGGGALVPRAPRRR